MRVNIASSPRPQSKLPPNAFQTYEVGMPRAHLRIIGCLEAECPDFEHGWLTVCDESEPLGAMQAAWIRSADNRRKWFECHQLDDGSLERGARAGFPTAFWFEPGQTCFNEHTTSQGPLLFLVREGDWRPGHRKLIRRHTRPADWVEDFSGTVERFNTNRNRG